MGRCYMSYSTIRDKYGLTQDEKLANGWQGVMFEGFNEPHIAMDVELICKTTTGNIETYCTPIWSEGTKEYMRSLKSDFKCIKS